MRLSRLLCWSCLTVVSFVAISCNGPLPFLSGGKLSGREQPAPARWNFLETSGVAQLETRPSDPYSINLLYVQIEDRMYVYAGDTETAWVKHMQTDPLVRLRVGDVVYAARAVRVTDAAELDRFSKVWDDLSVFQRDPTQFEEVWAYRLVPR